MLLYYFMNTTRYSTQVSVLAPLCVMFLGIGAWFVLDALTALFHV